MRVTRGAGTAKVRDAKLGHLAARAPHSRVRESVCETLNGIARTHYEATRHADRIASYFYGAESARYWRTADN